MPATRAPIRPIELLVSCEHGGNRIPARYRKLFSATRRLLTTHRAYDPGALTMARDFARAFGCDLHYSTVSRLLVELNRTLGHRQTFSRRVPPGLRDELIERYYRPYRERIEAQIAAAVRGGSCVLHLSCHSFTPRLGGVRRRADVGLLFDPRRRQERAFCTAWQARLREMDRVRVRRNYPYRGSSDGLTTYLRRCFTERDYLGIELEVNQRFPKADGPRWPRLRRLLVASFAETLQCDMSTGTVMDLSRVRVAPPSTVSRRRECP